ncbi:hypothetical protein [Salinispora arenicola]|uniref:hypothetical protein n=1 Tax=Salinispora arenicola TaxID=168697 RepID=UPI0003A5EF04|nr:hypothetical protein [Salinispora arenicola]
MTITTTTQTGQGLSPAPAELPEVLTLADIAKDLGLLKATVATYHHDATRRRREGRPRRGDLPEPDAPQGRRPRWKRPTYLRWKTNRPGQGAGGGRPWPSKE